jgi:hypothetical protein
MLPQNGAAGVRVSGLLSGALGRGCRTVAEALAFPRPLTIGVADPERFAFNDANTLLAVGSRDGNVGAIFDLADGREVARAEGIKLRDVAQKKRVRSSIARSRPAQSRSRPAQSLSAVSIHWSRSIPLLSTVSRPRNRSSKSVFVPTIRSIAPCGV